MVEIRNLSVDAGPTAKIFLAIGILQINGRCTDTWKSYWCVHHPQVGPPWLTVDLLWYVYVVDAEVNLVYLMSSVRGVVVHAFLWI